MPVDEWSADFIDTVNDANSPVFRTPPGVAEILRMLDIDSVSNVLVPISAKVRQALYSLPVTSNWQTIASQPLQLQPNEKQRLYFFTMQAAATGSNPVWLSDPSWVRSVRLYGAQRYFSMRGER